MDMAVITLVALVASGLTLFTGFGLGTLLMPAMAAFFPLPVAIAMTAVVHLAANLFKLALLGHGASRDVVVRFGVPAAIGAAAGALALTALGLAAGAPLVRYTLLGVTAEVTPARLVVGLLIAAFGVIETLPLAERLALPRHLLPVGGLISGYFGGLSGHQGALRSAFLVRAGLTPPAFVATGAVIACIVDVTRLGTYSARLEPGARDGIHWPVVIAASLAAFVGAAIGARLVKKTTLPTLRAIVSIALVLFGVALAAGLV